MVLVPFSTLINKKVVIPSARTTYFSVDRNHFIDLMKPVLMQVYVDEDWYVTFYPDVAQAIGENVVASATDHYVSYGFYEHRLPYAIDVDEPWYVSEYQDVRDAVNNGFFPSARDHFLEAGYREGRMPFANFALKRRTGH
jgi:hypothetical protein